MRYQASLSRIKLTAITLLSGCFMMASEIHASSVGLGIGRSVEFPGSSDYTFVPFASFEIETGIGTFKNNRLGVELDLVKSGAFDTGPILRANFGRDDSVSDPVVAALPVIDAAAEIGWFVGSGVQLKRLGLNTNSIVIGSLEAVTDAGDGHGGTYVSASIGLVMPITEQFRVVPSFTFNYADEKYTQSFYGVNSSNATPEGLTEFNASGGLESTQFALVVIRGINEKWSLTGVFAQNFLQGDAASSPITKRGSDENSFAGFTVNYQF